MNDAKQAEHWYSVDFLRGLPVCDGGGIDERFPDLLTSDSCVTLAAPLDVFLSMVMFEFAFALKAFTTCRKTGAFCNITHTKVYTSYVLSDYNNQMIIIKISA